MRCLLSSVAVAAALPGMAAANERPNLLDFLSVDIVVQRLLQTGIMGLRTQMDLKYSDMSVDFITGKITMTDFVAWPLPDWDVDGTCEIAIDRIAARGGALDQPDRFRVKLQASGVTFPASCLPDEPREAMAMAGISEIDMPRMTIDVDYGLPDSDLVIRAYADINDVATLDVTADFAYFWFDGRDDIEEPLPVAFLRRGTLAVDNKGIYEKLSPLAPPPFVSAGAGDMLKGMLGEELSRENRFTTDSEELTENQTLFLESLASSWDAFLAAPQTLVLETGYSGDVYLDLDAMDESAAAMFDILQPRVALAPTSRTEMLPAALLQSAMADPETLSPDDAKRVGIALMSGVGAPRNASLGFDLLENIAEGGDGEAAMALADAIEHHLPEDAYHWALLAGSAGEVGATAMLDRIERELAFEVVLQIQADLLGQVQSEEEARAALVSVASIREQAALRMSGRGLPRSYEAAALWAMLAAAAGDGEGKDIMAEISERARLLGPDAQAAWRKAETSASRQATEIWVGKDLPTLFGK